jgi:hypothetical protein
MYACCEMPEGHGLEAAEAHFNLVNAVLVTPTRGLLDRVVAGDANHPKLMNTLSMLEHMGSHKIMATQHGPHIDEATLRHLTEECHHENRSTTRAAICSRRSRPGCISSVSRRRC